MQSHIPTFALYGEFLEQTTPDYLHYERIRERSLRHNWTIKPHRHDGLSQLFLFEIGGVQAQLGDRIIATERPAMLFIPDMAVHAFQFPEDMKGGVISIAKQGLQEVLRLTGLEEQAFARPLLLSAERAAFQKMHDLFEDIGREFLNITQWRNEAMRALTQSLLIQIAREIDDDATTRTYFTPREGKVRHFCSLVEVHYTEERTLDIYASELGISCLQLNRDCRRILGKAPGEVVRARRLIEAKRHLAFTQMPVAEIGEKLGFKDVAYFSRFFRRMTGLTPTQHRNVHGIGRLSTNSRATGTDPRR